jgi:hypothetical protein
LRSFNQKQFGSRTFRHEGVLPQLLNVIVYQIKKDESRFKQPSCAAIYKRFLEFLDLFSFGNTLRSAADQVFDEDA